ncbi:hypothetical protein V1525DRAFT_400909 [Lipomyces kononenkoae]|uniref:Uncharacterized protein n=1 Tax=Lipomyces kononenkoae TaxID=34357 RepID=A0ACC3T3P9_LIPKO
MRNQLVICQLMRKSRVPTQVSRASQHQKQAYYHYTNDAFALHRAYLTKNGFRGLDTPFSHWCNRGGKRAYGQTACCINGVYHGRFATIEENLSNRSCGNNARPFCPGHGSPAVKCMYLHADGTIKPVSKSGRHGAKMHMYKALLHFPRCQCGDLRRTPGAPQSLPCYLERHLLQLFIDLHTSDPNHDIFADPAPGLVCLPLYSLGLRSRVGQNYAGISPPEY